MKLIKDDRTIARIENMLKTGKPLREAPVPGKTSAQLRAEAESASASAAKAAFDAAADKKPAVNDNTTPVRKARKTHAPKP
jgi:hypothetical protein